MDIHDNEKLLLSVSETDSIGNPVDSSALQLSYTSSDESKVTIVTDDTGTCAVPNQTPGNLGSARITALDAVSGLNGFLDVNVLAGSGAALSVTGTPQPITPPTS